MSLNSILDKLVPAKYKNDEDLYRKSRLFINACILSIFFVFIYGFFYMLIDYPVTSYICFSLAAVVLLTLLFYFAVGGCKFCTHTVGLYALAGLWLIAATTGGIMSPSIPWLLASPIAGFLFVNRRYGIFLTALMLISLFCFSIPFTIVHYPLSALLYGFVFSGFMIFIIIVVFFIYDRVITDILSRLKAANRQINEKIEEIEIKNKELTVQREKAETSSKAKAQFLSAMSHEIRTPMNTVIGMTHLLIQENPRPDQLENLKILKFSGEGLLALINDILDFSKIDAGKIEIEQMDFNLNELISGIVNSQNQRAVEKNIILKSVVDRDIPEMVVGDPMRLAQILNNIIGNAVKFTSKGNVSLDVLLEKVADRSCFVRFTVMDTGIGIPKSEQSNIFDSFTQAGTYITRRFGGTGLGLTITKKLLEMQGSRIHVESEEGKGSKFFFTLEFKKSNIVIYHEPSMPVARPTFESLEGVSILLVEDNEANTIIASKFLKKWDIKLDTAGNGQIAVKKVSENDYDIVLMDLQMPIMDGYEATNIIRHMEGEKYSELPIIALTASAMLDVHDRIIITGMNDFITKPFIPIDLYNKVKRWAKSNKK
jgi:signal transduction histidine kinase/CheY-like chemotaxis protein